jgi:DNA repair protein RadC
MYIKRIELRLLREKTVPYSGPINSAANVYEMFSWLSNNVQEEMHAIYLDTKNRVVGYYQVAKGSINHAHMKAADVLRPALLTNATSCILVHNHPSGDPEPSREDRLITDAIKKAAELFGLTLLDHIVIGDGRFKSLAEEGYLRKST